MLNIEAYFPHTMFRRGSVLMLAALLVAARCFPGATRATGATGVTRVAGSCSNGNDSVCCFMCPEIPACPALPEIPACPLIPACPSWPEIPSCGVFSQIQERPADSANLSAPHQVTRQLPCPDCPAQDPRAAVVSRALPEGYEVTYGAGPYKVHVQTDAFYAANRTCAMEGGSLATPTTQAELNALLSIMSANGIGIIHIGFHRSIMGYYTRITGEQMDELQVALWAPREPNGGTDYNCTFLHLLSQKIYDRQCTDTEPFICEIHTS